MINAEDVKAAVYSRLADNSGSLPDIDWPAGELDVRGLDEWVRPDVIGLNGQVGRKGTDREGTEIQVQVFVSDNGGNLYRAEEIADTIRGLFHRITFAASSVTVRCQEAATEPLGERDGVRGLVVRIPCQIET